MRFILGQPPEETGFDPDQDAGWLKVREMGPGTLMAVGSAVGIPLAIIFGSLWSKLPMAPLSFRMDDLGLGPWWAILFPLIIVGAIATFLIGLIFVHEIIHALAFPHFGLTTKTVFGVWPRRFLPYAHHSGPLSCRRLIVVALAPLIVLSTAPLLASYVGLLRSPLWALISIMNSVASGGDVAICLAIAYQVPFSATLRSNGWDTWWRPA